MGKSIDPAFKAFWVAEAAKQIEHVRSLAPKAGVNRSTLYRWCREAGVDVLSMRPPPTTEQEQKVDKLLLSRTVPVRAIYMQTGVSERRIRARRNELDLPPLTKQDSVVKLRPPHTSVQVQAAWDDCYKTQKLLAKWGRPCVY